jgi:hypothetical protein
MFKSRIYPNPSPELQNYASIERGSDASIKERISAIKLALTSYDNANCVEIYPDSPYSNPITIEQALNGILERWDRDCESRERQKSEYNMLYKFDGSPCPYCKHPHPDVNSL